MTASRDPGELGAYGFRNRKDHSYDGYAFATSAQVKVPRLWDWLGKAGLHTVVLGVPQTYPPSAVNGGDGELLPHTLDPERVHLSAGAQGRGEQVTGGYVLDVEDFRTADKAGLLKRVYDKTDKHLRLAKHLLRTPPLGFLHAGRDGRRTASTTASGATWTRHTTSTRREPLRARDPRLLPPRGRRAGPSCSPLPVRHAGAGRLGPRRQEDGRRPLLQRVADARGVPDAHGATVEADAHRQGGDRLGEDRAWGRRRLLRTPLPEREGPEPSGTIDPADYERYATTSSRASRRSRIRAGAGIGSRAYRPEDLYRTVTGIAPDLLVYFGDLDWRSVGAVGMGGLHTFENDTGPDEPTTTGTASSSSRRRAPRRRSAAGPDVSIYDIAPTLLHLMGQPVPDGSRARRYTDAQRSRSTS